ncbi:hypothetical protein BU25DRAFT_441545 [Macroventuria anomochaeta]|uniref:Uncharacterized protein n=1 Tax=Macroventuria anomochaeta TaxID=301207 RepID=A0ACB6RTK7_9PLEO|nr:uncharacterized protein BU25DRAFT_441545 [Macroventuria anomochaeta]KAF2625063.1 hypothetical protein BU25DRAFT_441545 [Macroventuria anomochaeta]
MHMGRKSGARILPISTPSPPVPLDERTASTTVKLPTEYSPLHMPMNLTRDEAQLFHHFIRHLGRWLDCTNAARIFTLVVSEKARTCPILVNAVLCFAARHRREDVVAEAAYERCVALLINRLNESPASYDEMLLAAVLLLHFADQLITPSRTCPRDKHHLKGTSSILRASMSAPFADPSATSLRDAAFWLYVRQSLYNATINQESLDIDFSLQLSPTPDCMRDTHSLAWLRIETAWANQMLWITACVANFCFSGFKAQYPQSETVRKEAQWQELWDRNQAWRNSRPHVFDPIGSGPADDGHVFPDIWFTADWHVLSYVFHHFSCILLLRYKPDSRFPIRWVPHKLSVSDCKILQHARAICSACKSSMQNVQLLIVLCHTVFIWGPLLPNPAERQEVIRMLRVFEETHSWRTEWIVDALRMEWGIASNGGPERE